MIGVPYGAAFAAPDGGVLACAQGRCVVEGRQSDGRAILSAFELTDTGAWRDVSGDDAFPSATERAAVIDLGGELGIAVQDQGDGAAVWMLYTWGGDRYAVVGCAADGAPPASVADVSPAACLVLTAVPHRAPGRRTTTSHLSMNSRTQASPTC